MTASSLVAQEGQEFRYRDGLGQDWVESWHPPELAAPDGRPNGSAGICFTPEEEVVLVTWPGVEWEFPAGRPQGDEDWRATLDREVLEEACAVVEDATLLGFWRVEWVRGRDRGQAFVRSLWCADVKLEPWEPRHETTGRLVVPADKALGKVGRGSKPVYLRWFMDALAAKGSA